MIQVSYLIVDDMHQTIPELTKDQYWDATEFQLPYTEATIHYQREAWLGSAADIMLVPLMTDRLSLTLSYTIRYDTIEEFNMDSKAEYTA